MKRLNLLSMLLLLTGGAVCGETVKSLVIHQSDNTEISVLMAENPIISFPESPTQMVISTELDKYQVDTKNVGKIMIEDTEVSEIEDITDDGFSVCVDSDFLRVKVKQGEANLSIYTLDGKRVMSRTIPGGEITLPIASLPNETLIIKVDEETIKLMRR